MAARSKARKRAVDVLYEADVRGADPTELLAERLAQADPPVPDYAVELVEGVVGNLERLFQLPPDQVGPLARYAQAIQSQRGDYNNKVLSIRGEDLRSLSIIYDLSEGELTERLIEWGVLAPDARSIDPALDRRSEDRRSADRA